MDANKVLHTIPNEKYERVYNEMSDYKSQYFQAVYDHNSDIVISEFEAKHDEWFSIVPYMPQCDLYGYCLIIYSNAVDSQSTFDRLNKLVSFISEFENYEYSHHSFHQVLYQNLGISWHNLDVLYDDYAIGAFKKSIFYLLGLSSHTSYAPVCYSFRRCTTYLYQALIKEQINLSSPTTFNDPFDSPIIALLNTTTDEISKLIRTAYLSCVKIACFVSNIMLPFEKDPNNPSIIVYDKPKQENNVPEFQNELMWAHYADYHKGICIKYHFPNSLSNVYSKPNMPVRYFRDVEYKEDLSVLNANDSITIRDAFFAKSKAWEYENELRFLQCDLNSKSDFDVIDVPNCIEAIYFGVRCPQRDIDAIKEIMKNKKFVTRIYRIINGKSQIVEDSQNIKYYRMAFDPNKFGSLVANPI